MLRLFLLSRQSKKKKTSQSENKVSEELIIDPIKNTIETKDEVENTTDELETKVDDKIEKELDDTDLETNPVKDENEVIADDSLADVESLPESQPENPAKVSKSSKRSTDRKSKSRSSRASKYVILQILKAFIFITFN